MSGLRVTLTAADVGAVQSLLDARYGLRGEWTELAGEYDNNFTLRSGPDVVVVKVMRPGCASAFVEMQVAAIEHLARRTTVRPVRRDHEGRAVQLAPLSAGDRFVWVLEYVSGDLLGNARYRSPALLTSVGRLAGSVTQGLAGFDHPAAHRDSEWDLSRAGPMRADVRFITDAARRALVERVLDRWTAEVAPILPKVRKGVIHGDMNDYNVIISPPRPDPRRAVGVIDFGDMVYSAIVYDAAITACYAAMGSNSYLDAVAHCIGGFHQTCPLSEMEVGLVWSLVTARLAMSVMHSARRANGDRYLSISEQSAWDALEQADRISPRFATYVLRAACEFEPVPGSAKISRWLAAQPVRPVMTPDPATTPTVTFDLSVGSRLLGANPAVLETRPLTELLWGEMRRAGVSLGIGRYDEPRAVYQSPAFDSGDGDRRTIHVGVDLFVDAGAPIFAPLDGVVQVVAENAARLDYGPMVILAHSVGDRAEAKAGAGNRSVYTIYGHLNRWSLEHLVAGQAVSAGEKIGELGDPPLNGDWPPHLHFQIALDLLEMGRDFPGVGHARYRDVWRSLSPDPNTLLRIPRADIATDDPAPIETRARREAHLGHALSLSYRRPIKIVRGWKQFLYDDTGRAYLDCYNNVPLVGHSHPRVVDAIQRQVGLLNTNTRYLHDAVVEYAERLTSLFPKPLSVCYFVNSASEANELALRMARAHTRAKDLVVLDAAYHGHTTTLVDISPYKFNGPGGSGAPDWVHVAEIPDDYRGRYRRDDAACGAKYAADVASLVDRVRASGRSLCGYIAESLPSVGGQIVLPSGYLKGVYAAVREAGGVCIADEVQVGFGRLGSVMWGFELQDVVPDIVVLGKPIGNAFPLGAVVTTEAIARSFANGMEFFSTFGGNPVAASAGLAVLDVLRDERLQENAARMGGAFLGRLRALQDAHACIGDVRGSGLFLGVEFARDRLTREPDAEGASYVANRLSELGVLTGTDGPHHNVIKIRPPLCFTDADANTFTDKLLRVLDEDAMRSAR